MSLSDRQMLRFSGGDHQRWYPGVPSDSVVGLHAGRRGIAGC